MIWFTPYDIWLIPAIILTFVAQGMVSSAYKKYGQIQNQKGYTGAMVARSILDRNGLNNVKIERISGNLTDHYDPRSNVIRLSDGVHDSSSIAAVGIAAHEVGHAIQHESGYAPIKLRNAILPSVQISSRLAMPIILVGLLLGGNYYLAMTGIFLYCAVVVFQIITLPVEFNASRRAVEAVYESAYLTPEETNGAKKVLRAAALTYLAAAFAAIMQLLRLLSIVNGGRRRR